MAGGRRYRDRVTMLTAPRAIGYGGQQARDWDSATRLDGIPARVQPLSATEDDELRQTTVSRWKLRLPPPGQIVDGVTVPDVDAEARFQWRDLVLEVDGEAMDHTDLMAQVHHQGAILRRAT